MEQLQTTKATEAAARILAEAGRLNPSPLRIFYGHFNTKGDEVKITTSRAKWYDVVPTSTTQLATSQGLNVAKYRWNRFAHERNFQI